MDGVHRTIAAIVALATLMGLGACSAEPSLAAVRPVTMDEAQLLATVRFRNFDAGARAVSTSLTDGGIELELDGWVDYASEIGYAVLAEDQIPSYLLVWDASTVAAKPTEATEAAALSTPPIMIPTSEVGFESSPLNTTGALHPLLAILISLGNDRPDNPLLLQQGGALWLREDTVAGTAVTVFSGPNGSDDAAGLATSNVVDPEASNTRYWIDADGLLLRFDVRLGVDWVSVLFSEAKNLSLTSPFTSEIP